MVIQSILGVTARAMTAEWILFLLSCVYMLVECIRNGIWDRHIKPNTGANLVSSLVAGIGLFLFTFAKGHYWPGALMAGVFAAVLCFSALQFTVLLYKKRYDQLENPEEDEE